MFNNDKIKMLLLQKFYMHFEFIFLIGGLKK